MQTGFSYFNGLRTAFKNRVRRLFYRFLFFFYKKSFSCAWKRDLFIGSLMSYGCSKYIKVNHDTLLKLVELFTLGTEGRALYMAYEVKDLIWKDLLINSSIEVEGSNYSLTDLKKMDLDDSQLLEVVDKIYSKTPNWLKYGSPFLLKSDITKVLLYCKKENEYSFSF